MNRNHQLNLIIGAIEDYRLGLMSLNMLRSKIQALLGILGDVDLLADIDSSVLAIDELSYDESMNVSWFKQDGQVIVQRALDDILHHVQRRRPAAGAIEEC